MASKIPKNATMAFKGRTWSVYQWKERMYDGSEGLFEGLKRNNDTVKIIATIGNKVISTKELQPGTEYYYSLPGGTIEDGETPLQAARRELSEETGLETDDWELFTKFDMLEVQRVECNTYIWLARGCKKTTIQKLDSGEKIDIIENTFDEFIATMLDEKSVSGNAAKKFLMNQENRAFLKEKLKLV